MSDRLLLGVPLCSRHEPVLLEKCLRHSARMVALLEEGRMFHFLTNLVIFIILTQLRSQTTIKITSILDTLFS